MSELKKGKKIHLVAFCLKGTTYVLMFQNCTRSQFKTIQQNDEVAENYIQGFSEGHSLQLVEKRSSCKTKACRMIEEENLAASEILKRVQKPMTGRSCINDTSVDACLFYKNPVASYGKAFSKPIASTQNLTEYQFFGVKLEPTTYTTLGCLSNSSYTILTDVEFIQRSDGRGRFQGKKSCFSSLSFKAGYDGTDAKRSVAQVMTHYYLNHQKSFMLDWTGAWYASGKNINVYSFINHERYNNSAFFSSDSSSGIKTGFIMLPAWYSGPRFPGEYQETALSAEVYLHEAGHGNLFFAADPKDDFVVKHRACGTKSNPTKNICCTSVDGCSRAINEGIADYHAVIMFPDNPSLGDSLVNNPRGFSDDGLFRNYSELAELMPQVAFNKPIDDGLDGEIHLTGYIWASIWYESRLAAKKRLGDRGVRSIDKLFSKHLLLIDGQSTFKSLCAETVNEASSVDAGLVKEFLNQNVGVENLLSNDQNLLIKSEREDILPFTFLFPTDLIPSFNESSYNFLSP